jgi:hypothetical protein
MKAARRERPQPRLLPLNSLKLIGRGHSYSAMDVPKHKSSMFLLTLGLVAAVAVRATLELIIPSRDTSSTPKRSGRRQPSATPFRSDDTSTRPDAAYVSPREQRIRERAFQIWLDEGKPNGRHQEHWRIAEAEIAE